MSENKSKRIYGQRVADEQQITVTLCNVFWNKEEDGSKSLALSHRDTRLRTEEGIPLDKQFTSIRFLESDANNALILGNEIVEWAKTITGSK